MTYSNNRTYVYQFGDPLYYNSKQGPDSFLFGGIELSYSRDISIKSRINNSPYADGDVDEDGSNQAVLNGSQLEVTFSVPDDYDIMYLRKIFVRKKKKIFFVEKSKFGERIYFNYARYISGLHDSFDSGSDDQYENAGNIKTFSVTLKMEDPRLFDVTDGTQFINPTALGAAINWESDIPGANWESDPSPNFNWESATSDYLISVANAVKNKTFEDYIPANIKSSSYYLTYENTWIDSTDKNAFDSYGNPIDFTLTNNNLVMQSISELDLNGYDDNSIFHIWIETSGGLATDNFLLLRNSDTPSGFKFTWKGATNSPNNILINTAQPYVFDLDAQRVIPRSDYSLSFADSSYTRLLVVQSTAKPRVYPNPLIPDTVSTLEAQKSSSSNMTVHLNNLKITF